MEKSITLKNEAKENLIKESLFCAKIGQINKEKNDLFKIESILSNSISHKNREAITNQCVEIANSAHFSTDYNDVYDHLFGSNYELSFLKYNGEIKGFAVFDTLNINAKKVLHLHGIIVSPSAQHFGNTRNMLKHKINETNADILTLKTHNPRMYSAASSLAKEKNKVFPNFQHQIPSHVLNLSKNNHFISGADNNLVVKNAYPDEKIQQQVSNDIINNGFKNNLGKLDAQAVIVYLD